MASKRVSEKKLVVSPGTVPNVPVRKPATSRRSTRSAKPVENPATPAVEMEFAAAVVVEPPSPEAIAALAYSYWVARGCEGGSPEEDWLRAEQELRALCATA